MRKISILFAAISMFASCNSDQKSGTETTKDVVGTSDTSALKNNTMADTGHFAPAPVAPPVVTTKTEKRVDNVKATTHKTAPNRTPSSTVTPAPATVNNDTKTVTPAPATQGTGTTAGTSTTPAAGTTTSTTTTAPAVPPAKKGWSSAAKDATIGGVGGAIGGAIISKKKGKGAIIGGALGAAGGYILGRKKDKAQAKDTAQ